MLSSYSAKEHENLVLCELSHISPRRKDDILLELGRILDDEGHQGDVMELPQRLSACLYDLKRRSMGLDLSRLKKALRGLR